MNFSEWLNETRLIRKVVLNVLTMINAISLLFWILVVDAIVSWQPYLIMSINFCWLVAMAYRNGWVCGTDPWERRKDNEL